MRIFCPAMVLSVPPSRYRYLRGVDALAVLPEQQLGRAPAQCPTPAVGRVAPCPGLRRLPRALTWRPTPLCGAGRHPPRPRTVESIRTHRRAPCDGWWPDQGLTTRARNANVLRALLGRTISMDQAARDTTCSLCRIRRGT